MFLFQGGGASGNLVVAAGASQVFTGNNIYNGTTTIGAGATVYVGQNTAGGTLGTGFIFNDGTLIYGRTAAAILANRITGSGSLDQEGAGLLTITAANGYTGATTVGNGRLLALSGMGSIGSSSMLVLAGGFDISGTIAGASIKQLVTTSTNGGTIALGNKTLTLTNGNGAFSGTIQDGGLAGGTGGALAITGGVQTLTGNNSYTGATTIAGGAGLAVGNSGTTGSLGSGAVTNNGSVYYELSSAATVNNVISGSGSFVQRGTGTLTLTANNSYTGATGVLKGTLLVDGSIASSSRVDVMSGATLGGIGTVGAVTVQSGGKLAAGDAPGAIGALHVNGNLTFQSGTLTEDISASATDQIIVSGNVSLGGQLVESFAGGSYGHHTFTLLHADGNLTGTFSGVSITGLPAGLDAQITYDAHNVYLTTDNAPVVATTNVTAQHGQTLAVSNLFMVNDPDGDTITNYQFWDTTTDPNSGHFVVNGVVQAARTVIEVTAAQLSQVSFVAGTAGDALQIRAYDGAAWSAVDAAQWSPFTVSISPNAAPVLTTANVSAQHNQTLALSSLFTVSDADNDTITKYQLWDTTTDPNSGHFVVNGVAQTPRTVVEIAASQLAQTSFVTGSVGDYLQIRAFDGLAWSAVDSAQWSPFNVTVPVNHAPVLATYDVAAQRNQTLALSSLFTVSDADNDTITKYQLWDTTTDPNSGHFVVNGVAQAPRTVIEITAAQLAQTSFVTGSVSDYLQIRAFDSTAWSAVDSAQWSPFNVTVPVNHTPVVTTSDVAAQKNQTLALSSLFTVSDADNDTITKYQLWDTTTDPNSGHFVVNGVAQTPRTVIELTGSQLAQTSFVTGSVGDMLQIRAFDGTAWSAVDSAVWSPFNVTVPVNHAPVLTTSDVAAQKNQTLALSSLFTVSDADSDTITRYQLWDTTTDPNSGHFVVNGVAQAPRTVIELTASQLAQTSFVTGSVSDYLQIRAFDDTAWSAADSAQWSPFNITVPANHAPVLTTSDVNAQRNQTLALTDLFMVSDADNDTITRYQLWDTTTDPNSGHFVVNGAAQAPRTVVELTGSQLAQTSFVTGGVGDYLQIRAFDGTAWSAADSAQWSPFNVTVPPNHAPVVTTADLTKSAGQSLTASSLFTVSDADNDTITKYQFWDTTTDPTSGHFVVNGADQAPRTVIELPASDLSQVSFLTGSSGDMLQVRAFDGTAWSAADSAQWSPFHIAIS